jgi:hypothetical protein
VRSVCLAGVAPVMRSAFVDSSTFSPPYSDTQCVKPHHTGISVR